MGKKKSKKVKFTKEMIVTNEELQKFVENEMKTATDEEKIFLEKLKNTFIRLDEIYNG